MEPPSRFPRALSESNVFHTRGDRIMGRGGARIGAGRPARPLAEHVLSGRYRRDRHGPKPASVLALPPPPRPRGGPRARRIEPRSRPGPASGSTRSSLSTSSTGSAASAARSVAQGRRRRRAHARAALEAVPRSWQILLSYPQHSRKDHHLLSAATVYVTLRVEELPTASFAVTTNVFVPMGDVVMRLPFATGPAHDVIPEPPSLQA